MVDKKWLDKFISSYSIFQNVYSGDPDTGVWVGGSDNGHHGIWTWFATGELIRWWDWGPGQPQPGKYDMKINSFLDDYITLGKDQHCLYVVGGWLGYQWADFHCDFQVIKSV